MRPVTPTTRVNLVLGLLVAWTAAREAQILWLPGLDGPWFSKPAYWTVILTATGLCALRGLGRGRTERASWLLIAAGGTAWALADVYWSLVLAEQDTIPVPSVSDIGYLLFYPLVFAGLATLVRGRVRSAPSTLWLDGLTAALAAGAVSAAVVVEPLLDVTGGETAAVATNLAYSVGDLILLGMVVTAVALGRWRMDRTWLALGTGVLCFWVADSFYLVTTANSSYVFPGPADQGWTICLILFAVAAWSGQQTAPVRDAPHLASVRGAVLPSAFAAAGLAVLTIAAFADLNPLAVVLAAASLVAVVLRLVLTLHENSRMLHRTAEEARTDALTGLGNRRALTSALDERLRDGPAAAPFSLVLLDLDGFKDYNDAFGHPAGDALLQRLGAALDAHVGAAGRAFRMGGDEFCVLLDGTAAAGAAAHAAQALRSHGEGFAVTASFGEVTLPREAACAEQALRTADNRMYADKASGRRSAGRQTKDVLLRVLAERDPDLGQHNGDVADLAAAVAEELGLARSEVDAVRHAAELHDVGKVAIPDAILSKPEPLDDDEWTFMRNHTLIGERIVAAAPALSEVAALVRSSHERWDGGGYPDGLAGTDIPLGARIVAVCDAFDAMVTFRPYSAARPEREALEELERCSGTQFDPAVLRAFSRVSAGLGRRAPVPA